MKKPIIITIIAIAVLLFSADSYAQRIARHDGAVSNHSVSVQIIGAEYAYEQSFGGNFTLIGRAGLMPVGLDYYKDAVNFNASFTSALGVTLEPRFYTSMQRRMMMGRPSYNNASDFVGLKTSILFYDDTDLTLTPVYGIRRSYGKHWFGEFTGGAQFSLVEGGLTPHDQIRFGFVF